MRSDVHSAALRAAAKVAFSVAFISGCSAPTADGEDVNPANNTDGVEPGVAESDITSKPKKHHGTKADHVASGCHADHDASVPPKLSCDQVVNAAFPTEGNYPGTKKSVSIEVQTCCAELLGKSDGMLEHHRWDCCANLPSDAGQNIGIACTPWGPPVPPSMKRAVRAARLEVV